PAVDARRAATAATRSIRARGGPRRRRRVEHVLALAVADGPRGLAARRALLRVEHVLVLAVADGQRGLAVRLAVDELCADAAGRDVHELHRAVGVLDRRNLALELAEVEHRPV